MDEARVARAGGNQITLRSGINPYMSKRGHAKRNQVTTLVRLRYQRNGVFEFFPDLDGEWLPRLKPGARLRIRSRVRRLESFHLDADRNVIALEYTTFRIKSMSDDPDRAISCQLEEDPDLVWRVYTTLPNIDPDVSEPGIIVDAMDSRTCRWTPTGSSSRTGPP